MPDTPNIIIPIDPQTVDAEKAAALQKQYGAELEKTRGALSTVQGQRQDVTTRNLGAIDEAIQALKNSRQTGPIAFDPAVSAAMAAGFLKTTPGVAGNFMTELGGAMGNAAPVISNKLKGDRDSFQILADLQTKRGEFEAKPLQEQQKTLEEREKEQATGLRTVEQAALKGATASERAAAGKATADEKARMEREKFAEKIRSDAETEIKAAITDKEVDGRPINDEEQKVIRKFILRQRINDHNQGRDPSDPNSGFIPVERYPLSSAEEETAKGLMGKATPALKGEDKVYRDYVMRERQAGREPMPLEVWKATNQGRAAAEVEKQKELAKTEMALPAAIEQSKLLKNKIDALLVHPGLNSVVGPVNGKYPETALLGGDANNFMALYNSLKASAFLEGIKGMRGTGPISDAEGKKVEATIGALARTQTVEAFRASLQSIMESIGKMEAEVAAKQREIVEGKKRDAAGSGGAGKVPTPAHIEHLRANPATAAQFDEIYGVGAAAKVLGK